MPAPEAPPTVKPSTVPSTARAPAPATALQEFLASVALCVEEGFERLLPPEAEEPRTIHRK